MHGNVRLKVVLNVFFILFESKFDVLLISIGSRNPIEVLSDLVLLIIESLVVCATNRENMLGEQLAEHGSIVHQDMSEWFKFSLLTYTIW